MARPPAGRGISHGRLGFLGLSIIALVFVLTTYWQG
jgi:hypothetical protein